MHVGPAGDPPALIGGQFSIYRLYSIGDEIDLALATASLGGPGARRRQPSGVRQADSIQIAQPPLRLDIGNGSLQMGSIVLPGTLRATIYDLGAVAIVLTLPLANPTRWATVAEFFRLAPELPAVGGSLAGRLRVQGGDYAVPINRVQEIVRVPEITRVPQAQFGVEGVINLRGRVLPVVDLDARLGLGITERARSARLVVVDGGTAHPNHHGHRADRGPRRSEAR